MSVFLKVTGDDDYAAMEFEDHLNTDTIYNDMIEEGVTEKSIVVNDTKIYVTIHEFGEVDPEFEQFAIDVLGDYDLMKNTNFYRVK